MPFPHAECLGDTKERDQLALQATERQTDWQALPSGAGGLTATRAPVGVTVRTVNLRLPSAPFRGAEFSRSVLLGVAFKIPSQKSMLGKDMLRELCPREVTIWPIFISPHQTPRTSVGTGAGWILACRRPPSSVETHLAPASGSTSRTGAAVGFLFLRGVWGLLLCSSLLGLGREVCSWNQPQELGQQ